MGAILKLDKLLAEIGVDPEENSSVSNSGNGNRNYFEELKETNDVGKANLNPEAIDKSFVKVVQVRKGPFAFVVPLVVHLGKEKKRALVARGIDIDEGVITFFTEKSGLQMNEKIMLDCMGAKNLPRFVLGCEVQSINPVDQPSAGFNVSVRIIQASIQAQKVIKKFLDDAKHS